MKRTDRSILNLVCFFASALALARGAGAEEPAADHCAEFAGRVNRALLVRPIALGEDLGRLHQSVTTKSNEAQAYYDQGIALLASYVWVDAARSFHEALRLDPDLAIAHLGLAKALRGVEDEDDALAEYETARKLAESGGATEKEKKWIEIGCLQREAIFAPEEGREKKHEEYKQAIDALIKMDPAGAHAWTLRGTAEEPGAWGRGQVGEVASIAYYEAALLRDPDFFPAHHFLVHSYENIGRYAESAEHGERYAALAPAVPHAHHMVAHVLPRLGRWSDALARFQEADRLSRRYALDLGVAPEEDWHHEHNIHLEGTVYLRMGDQKRAEELFQELFRLDPRGFRGDTNASPWIEYLILRERNQEALAAADEVRARGNPMARLVGSSLAGHAHVAMKEIDAARADLESAKAAFADVKAETEKQPQYQGSISRIERRFIGPLAAELALFGDDADAGSKAMIDEADRIAETPNIDAWVSGLFEIERMAATARRAGRPELADQLLERIAKIDPEYAKREEAVGDAGQ